MGGQLFASTWYRVGSLRPRLRQHVEVHAQMHRGVLWTVLRDAASSRHMLLNPVAWTIVAQCEGRRTLDEIWREAGRLHPDQPPSQDDVLSLMGQLHQADMLYLPRLAHMEEQAHRADKKRRQKWLQYVRSPLSVKFPLWDPDRFLARTLPWTRMAFTRVGALAVCALTVWLVIQAVVYWDALTMAVSDNVFSAANMVLIAAIYPFVKLVHELAHGWAVKRWGGSVHEMGVMLLVLLPIPYVDASDSLVFQKRSARIAVAAAGIAAELIMAAVAMGVWQSAEPGLTRAVAFNVLLICGVSTLLVNGNPLMKYDGYYVFAEAIHIPNLAQRANAWWGEWFRRHFAGMHHVPATARMPGEARWLAFYGASAFFYRIWLMTTILLFVASQYFELGVILALWAGIGSLLIPFLQKVRAMRQSIPEGRFRSKARMRLILGMGALLALVGWLPMPLNTISEGVILVDEKYHLQAPEACTLVRVTANEGQEVTQGEPVGRCVDEELEALWHIERARLESARTRVQISGQNATERRIAEEALAFAEDAERRARSKVERMQLLSPATGQIHWAVPVRRDEGNRFARGQLLAWVVVPEAVFVRTALTSDQWERVRKETTGVQILTARDNDPVHGRLARTGLGAVHQVPHVALSTRGGGTQVANPSGQSPLDTLEPLFWVDIVPGQPLASSPNERVWIRFEHPPEPLIYRFLRGARRTFLRLQAW